MNGLAAGTGVLEAVMAGYGPALRECVDLLVCPPATLVAGFAARVAGSGVAIGGQDCHTASSGPHTGDVAAVMLVDAGASHVIVGHSERRADHGETDAGVKAPRPVKRAKPEVGTPAELTEAFAAGGAGQAFWDGLPPSGKREYAEWIESAKRPETRAKRVATTLAQLAEGKRHNWQYANC